MISSSLLLMTPCCQMRSSHNRPSSFLLPKSNHTLGSNMVVARRCFLSPSLRSAKRVLRFALGKLPKILEKHLWHGSSICWSYRRRCNVVGDLMRHLLCWPAFLLLFNTKFSVESIGVLLFWRALQRRVVHSSVELCTPQLWSAQLYAGVHAKISFLEYFGVHCGVHSAPWPTYTHRPTERRVVAACMLEGNSPFLNTS